MGDGPGHATPHAHGRLRAPLNEPATALSVPGSPYEPESPS